jgi:hypothetical protein
MDEWKQASFGLFQQYRDGGATAITSYVDRSLSTEGQLQQLRTHLEWLPEQVIAAVVKQITEGKYTPAEIRAVSGGRLVVPTPAMLAALLSPAEFRDGHPVRSYLWPSLTPDARLALEPDEALVDRIFVPAPRAMTYAGLAYAHITTHRIATIAKLSLPTQQRGDYKLSLGLISPTLMDGYAALKQISRIGQNKHRQWVQHVRYEWLTSITKRTTTTRKRKLFGGEGPEHVSTMFRADIRYPWGKVQSIDLVGFEDLRMEALRDPEKLAQKTADFERRLEELIRARGFGWTHSGSRSREIINGTEAHDVYTVDPDAAYAFPPALVHSGS